MTMELAWLLDFIALSETGNFSRAAAQRHVTQPAFSRRVRALETWMGVTLFDRTPQGAVPTAAARQILPAVREIARRLPQMRQEAREIAGQSTPVLHFAATHSLSFTFFPDWIRRAGQGAPLEAVRLSSDSMAACEQLLASGQAQFLLCHHLPGAPLPLDPARFDSCAVGHDALLPLAAPAPGQRRATSRRKQAPLPYLAYDEASGLGRIVQQRLAHGGDALRLEPVFRSHLAAVLMSMARQGKGMAWLPASLAEQELAEGSLAPALPAAWRIDLEIRLCRPRATMSAFAEAYWSQVQAPPPPR